MVYGPSNANWEKKTPAIFNELIPKNDAIVERSCIFQTIIFGIYLRFPGCINICIHIYIYIYKYIYIYIICKYITSYMTNPSTNASSTEQIILPWWTTRTSLHYYQFPSNSKKDIAKSGCTAYPTEAGYTQVRRLVRWTLTSTESISKKNINGNHK